jgi:hypothetical protein
MTPSAPLLDTPTAGRSDEARSPWYRPGSADLLFLILALLIFQGARRGMLDDPGLGWHLRNIDAIRAHGWWLTTDPFTFPFDAEPRPWFTNQWLGELPLWLGWHWAGEEGVAAVVTLVLAFTLRCLYRILLRDGLPWPAAVIWTCLAALGTAVSWVARPNIFTMLFLLVVVRVCDLFHQGRVSRRRTLWLCPLFAVWANVHGGFLAGLMTLATALAVEAALAMLSFDSKDRGQATGRALHLALLLTGSSLAVVINPYGIALYRWVLQLLDNPFFMDLNHEWKSPNFRDTGSGRFELLMLLFPLLLGISRRRPNLVELALSVLWLHFALTGFRYVALWVLVATPLMARSSMEVPWLEEAGKRMGLAAGEASLFRPHTGPAPWFCSVIIAIFVLAWAKQAEGRLAGHNPEIIPTAALQKVLALHRDRPNQRVFHSYDWGGYLTWYGWPRLLNWIDDRNEVQGQAHIEDYFSIVRADPGWQRKLEPISILALHTSHPLAQVLGNPETAPRHEKPGELEKAPDWEEVYRDGHAVVFVRK